MVTQICTNTYLHVAYSSSADGSASFSTSIFDGAAYTGSYVSSESAEITDYKKYAWNEYDSGDYDTDTLAESLTEDETDPDAVFRTAAENTNNSVGAQETSDVKIQTYYQADEPNADEYVFNVGDIWFDTDAGNAISIWNGTAWEKRILGSAAIGELLAENIKAGSITANKINLTDLFAQDITATGTIRGVKLVGGSVEGAVLLSEKTYNTDWDFGGGTTKKISVTEKVEINNQQINISLYDNTDSDYIRQMILDKDGIWADVKFNIPGIYCANGPLNIDAPAGAYIDCSSGRGNNFSIVGADSYNILKYDNAQTAGNVILGSPNGSNTRGDTNIYSPHDINLNAAGDVVLAPITSTQGTKVNSVGTINSPRTTNAASTSASPNLYISSNHNIVKTSGSSKRWKSNIKNVFGNLDPRCLYDLPVRQFNFIDKYLGDEDERNGKTVIGFIAEEINDIYPIAVNHGIDDNGNVVCNDWESRYMIPGMMYLIQDLNNRLKKLEVKK